MPLTGDVFVLRRDEFASPGGFLRAVGQGSAEPADLLAVAVGADGAVVGDEVLDGLLGVPAAEIVASAQLTGKAGQTTTAVVRAGGALVRVVFLGVADRSPAALRKSGGELGRLMRAGELAVADVLDGLDADQVEAFAEGVLLGSYRFSERSADLGAARKRFTVRLAAQAERPDVQAAVDRATVVAAAVALTRDLANTPSLRKTPAWLAEAAADVAASAGLSVTIRTEQDLVREGFGGILAVGAGSARPPALIELRYAPADARQHVVLVGKGITFDSGGLSLKPNDGMKMMKTDMAGGAAVIAVMSALARLAVPLRVTGLVAAAENLPSGSAYRPSDVITHFGGKTVEVLNTDAEGRLVLADAMAYAVAELAPDRIVDVATLTGAARIALGGSRAALYSTDDGLASELLAAGESSGDRLWRMPLPDEYLKLLDSPVAELSNVSTGDGEGRLDRRCAVPARVRRRPAVGAPGHRGRGSQWLRRRRDLRWCDRVRDQALAELARWLGWLAGSLDGGQQAAADRQEQRD